MIRRMPRTGFYPTRDADTRFWIRKLVVIADIPEQLLGPRLVALAVSNLQKFAKKPQKTFVLRYI